MTDEDEVDRLREQLQPGVHVVRLDGSDRCTHGTSGCSRVGIYGIGSEPTCRRHLRQAMDEALRSS